MKLLVLPLLVLAAAVAAAEAAADPYVTDVAINNRKLKQIKVAVHGNSMHVDPAKTESRRAGHLLLEKANGGTKNAAVGNGGAFAHDAAGRAAENAEYSNVSHVTDPTVTVNGNNQINDYPAGAGLGSHHTIDLQIWNKMHPPKPST